MVPISLLVTVEVVKFAQALFIAWDINIYDTERDMPTRVQSSNLNEELGQISHIFSDKTGTLTSNVMLFRGLSAGMRRYGNTTGLATTSQVNNNKDTMQTETNKIPNVDFVDDNFYNDYALPTNSNAENIKRMLLNLALNHAVQVEKPEYEEGSLDSQTTAIQNNGFVNENIVYNASSPDELALVNGARFLGCTYLGRDEIDNNIFVVGMSREGETCTFELLNAIEFNSTRKRMTSVFRDTSSG